MDPLPSRFQIDGSIMIRGYRKPMTIDGVLFGRGKVYYQAGGLLHDSCDIHEPPRLSIVETDVA